MKAVAKSAAGKGHFWRKHMEGWRRSGRSQREYCRKHGLALRTFRFWRGRLTQARVSPRLEVVPVPQRARLPEPSRAPIVLVLEEGRHRVEIREGVRPEVLRGVLDVLGVR
jgi:hypothetical protein